MADTLNPGAPRTILETRMRGGPQPAPTALGLLLRNACKRDTPLSETNFLAGYVHTAATPALPGADGRFYHEVQRVDSGTCALHALNAYSGSAKYTIDHLAHAQKTLSFEKLTDEQAKHVALDGNEAPFVNAALTAVEGAVNHAMMEKSRLELITFLDKQDASIDRVMVGLAGAGESGHWVAFRRDAARKWHRIDSFPSHIVEGDPQPIQSPADFLRNRTGTGSCYAIIYR